MDKYKVGDSFEIMFFEQIITFKVTKSNTKGITLKNDLLNLELKNYTQEELESIIINKI